MPHNPRGLISIRFSREEGRNAEFDAGPETFGENRDGFKAMGQSLRDFSQTFAGSLRGFSWDDNLVLHVTSILRVPDP